MLMKELFWLILIKLYFDQSNELLEQRKIEGFNKVLLENDFTFFEISYRNNWVEFLVTEHYLDFLQS